MVNCKLYSWLKVMVPFLYFLFICLGLKVNRSSCLMLGHIPTHIIAFLWFKHVFQLLPETIICFVYSYYISSHQVIWMYKNLRKGTFYKVIVDFFRKHHEIKKILILLPIMKSLHCLVRIYKLMVLKYFTSNRLECTNHCIFRYIYQQLFTGQQSGRKTTKNTKQN